MTAIDIKEKIKKLLALAQSPNEHEAKAALLKAKELMAKHKMSEGDIEDKDLSLKSFEAEDIQWTTDSGRTWMAKLCQTICDNYCCTSAWRTPSGSRTHILVITGIGDDLEICKAVVGYAVGFIEGQIKVLTRRYGRMDPKVVANSYALGFITGLEMAYEEQKDEHPEWGLVVVKPEEVRQYEENLKTRSVRTKKVEFNPVAHAAGLKDGTNFNPNKVLTAKEA